jgi:hypothetical protein
MDQSNEVCLDCKKTRSVKTEEELAKDAVCHQTCSTYTVNTLPRKLLKSFKTSKLKDK